MGADVRELLVRQGDGEPAEANRRKPIRTHYARIVPIPSNQRVFRNATRSDFS